MEIMLNEVFDQLLMPWLVPKHIGMNEGFLFTPCQILIAISEVLIEICNENHVWQVPICILGI